MKLIIQIPCFNEEHSIQKTLNDLPKKIEGVKQIKTLIIDDGSQDKTIERAIESDVDYVVKNNTNRGLAYSFNTGIEACLALGADIIVNTDGDNQYQGECINKLIKPILEGSHEIVIGKRPIMKIEEFSMLKKILQKFGSFIVSKIAGVNISDTTSGFRAFTRNTAFSISTITDFTYTLETIIFAGKRKIPITEVPIKVNKKQRESRLFSNIFEYIFKSIIDIIFISISVQPLRIFGSIGIIFFTIGILIGLRFIILSNFSSEFGEGFGHIQSLILSSILMITGFSSFLFGLIAKQISASRILVEKLLINQRRKDFNNTQNLNEYNIIYIKK